MCFVDNGFNILQGSAAKIDMADRHDQCFFIDGIDDFLDIDMNAIVAFDQMNFCSVFLPPVPKITDRRKMKIGKNNFIPLAGKIETGCNKCAANGEIMNKGNVLCFRSDNFSEESADRI